MDELKGLFGSYDNFESKLPTEKLFAIARFNAIVDSASKEQLMQIAKETYKYMVYKEEFVNQLLKKDWGLDSNKAA
jgi:hypothetical protein